MGAPPPGGVKRVSALVWEGRGKKGDGEIRNKMVYYFGSAL